jgi:hypothetical protein
MGKGSAAEKAAAAIADTPGELHALALLWRVFVDFLRSLFGRKSGKAG